MAIYYLNAQVIGRSKGRTATGAAAYRAGERIVDERTGQVYDYTRRRGDIETDILAPTDAPAWARDRAHLWNQVEMAERRADAQVAREIVVAIPLELDREQQRELVRQYVQERFVSKGMVADVALHRNPGNPHAHIMLTMREIGPDGFSAKKNREWNKPEHLERWREEWAAEANRALERAGRGERIDHRSLEAQGLDRQPQVHLGPHAAALERQGIATEGGEHNRLVAQHNAVVIALDRARKEREMLRTELAVQEREVARTRAGWLPEQARAMSQLEAEAGGRQLSYDQIHERWQAHSPQHAETIKEIRDIEKEGWRLDRAEHALEQHSQAVKGLNRHETPVATVKRWFSQDARREYRKAIDRVEWTRIEVQRQGTPTVSQFQRERAVWQQRAHKLPELNARADALSRMLNTFTKAMHGFARQEWREYDQRLRERRRERERSLDRDLDRGR